MENRRDGDEPACIMVQGTGSNVGKSVLVAGLARAFSDRNLAVRPFKPQNMSNNAGVTVDNGEIGRAQMTQAVAARVAPSTDMNPVLLKPESETGAQVIVQGRRLATMKAREYGARKSELLDPVLTSFSRLKKDADLLLVEGAGSPAEINLRDGDIANMGFAEAADVPVILVGDIDRGGVIASLVGTHSVLSDRDRSRIKGFIINKFRGDPSLFDDGVAEIERRTGWFCLGVVPYTADAARLPAEDVLGLEDGVVTNSADIKIAVPRLNRIANFDDLDPLRAEAEVQLIIVQPGEPLPGDADIVLIPGSKSTIADLHDFRDHGWDIDLKAHIRRGGSVLGICGGYQMLGRTIADPDGIEGTAGESAEGLGLLDVTTVLSAGKTLRDVTARHLQSGTNVSGYEIHLGRTEGSDTGRPFAEIDGRPDGAISPDGQVIGTYLHGLFVDDLFRQAFLEEFGVRAGERYLEGIDSALDSLARHLENHLDLDRIFEIARGR